MDSHTQFENTLFSFLTAVDQHLKGEAKEIAELKHQEMQNQLAIEAISKKWNEFQGYVETVSQALVEWKQGELFQERVESAVQEVQFSEVVEVAESNLISVETHAVVLEEKNTLTLEVNALAQKIDNVKASFEMERSDLLEQLAAVQAQNESLKIKLRETEFQKQKEPQKTTREVSAKREVKTEVFAPKKVLVVDDAEMSRVLMSHYFKGLPLVLEFSFTAQDALNRCQKLQEQGKRFDLIFMDLQMNELNGLEITKKIRDFDKQTPVFGITAIEPSLEEKSASEAAGCSQYFAKNEPKEYWVQQVSECLF